MARFAVGPVLGVAGAVAAVQAALAGRYGFHRDELYFLAAGRHLAWGYVDQPPLTPLLARLSTAVFGDGPAGLRMVAVLLCAATIVLTAFAARELGARRAGQVLAAAGAAVSAMVLALGHVLSTASFDLFVWTLLGVLVLRLLRTGERRWWLAIGAAAGVALLNKDLVLLLALVLLPAIACCGPGGGTAPGPRAVLRGWWLPAGALLALLVAAPNLSWQAVHGWPQLTVASGISGQDGLTSRLTFVPMQLAYLSPVLVPIWLAGFRRLREDLRVRWARPWGYAYLALCGLVLALGGKPYYALPPLLLVLAAGCGPFAERLWGRPPEDGGDGRGGGPGGGTRRDRVRTVGLLLVAALLNSLITLPVLPADRLSAVSWLYPESAEQVGWPELTAAVAAGWARVPPEQRGRAVVFAADYGEAGALVRYGGGYGLPAVYSGHMSFYDWGPPPDSATGPVLVVHPAPYPEVERAFTGCRRVAEVDNGRGVANEEQHAPVLLCAGTVAPWSRLWPRLRHFY
ncbi:dolichyl-phosphate-mannose-protein mannosyltransferase [Kitasatospora sp. SolWspMP-SS2h]|uniref:ArnT family glycosyltransferase n=1 Tax=Kitasatospora sp. SolWspMP-SS2h TaxID=1305729 RepID=UPI000DC052A0|nr:glycosyltransferase family 39 protein [Kitasatospora sp. SolWspMP-SS2h]RAJ46217.1 dolichyl-phosphate-mannose-protein mannosyltransferase [Kitasatospora sp. SolWspMP-SS2h]